MAGQRPNLVSTTSGQGATKDVNVLATLLPVSPVVDYTFAIPTIPTGNDIALFVAPYDLVIDEVIVRYAVAFGAAKYLVVGKAASGVAFTFAAATAVTCNGAAANCIDMNAAAATNLTGTFRTSAGATTASDATKPPSENIIPRGTTVGIMGCDGAGATGALSGGTLAGLTVTFRCCTFRA